MDIRQTTKAKRHFDVMWRRSKWDLSVEERWAVLGEKTTCVNTCKELVATQHPTVPVAYGAKEVVMYTKTRHGLFIVFCQRARAEGDNSQRKGERTLFRVGRLSLLFTFMCYHNDNGIIIQMC